MRALFLILAALNCAASFGFQCTKTANENFGFDQFCEKLGGDGKAHRSLQEVLEKMSDDRGWREARVNAVLMRRSRALGFNGEAEQPFPRIILNRGNLVVGITPDKKHPDNQSMEIIETLPDGQLRFRELVVKQGKLHCRKNADEESIRGIRKCSSCHSSETVPLAQRKEGPHSRFITPNFHFGSFGGLEGRVKSGTVEHAEFSRLQERKEKNTDDYEFYDILGVPGYRREGTQASVEERDYVFNPKGAERLRAFIDRNNAKRISTQLKSSEHFSTMRFALLGAMVGCDDFSDFFPEAVARRHGRAALSGKSFSREKANATSGSEMLASIEAQMKKRLSDNRDHRYFEEIFPENDDPKIHKGREAEAKRIDGLSPLDRLAKLEMVLAGHGLSTATWSTESDGPRSHFRFTGTGKDGSGTALDEIACGLIPEIVRSEAALNTFRNGNPHPSSLTGSHEQYCALLARRSRESYQRREVAAPSDLMDVGLLDETH